MADWYSFLSQLNAALSGPLDALSGRLGIPVLSAFILGLVGATAPCQLSANLAALAYISRQGRDPRQTSCSIAAYVLGKVLVYTLLGLVVLGFGLTVVSGSSIPFFSLVRKAMGPALVLGGLLMIGVLPLPFSLGDRISHRLAVSARGRGSRGAFLLGAAFSLAFCPTMFVLFFALLMPMSLQAPGGITFPGFFAVGTAAPLLVLGPLISLGLMDSRGLARRARRLDAILRPLTGAIFVLLGLSEIINYWVA